MDRFFIIQLISSFVVGGILVATLSFLSEKVSSKFSGIILSFPSTAALGYFFLGWTLSPEQVSEVVPASFIPLGLCALFPPIYLYLAIFIEKHTVNKSAKIAFCFILSTFIWILLSLPIILFKFNNLIIGLIIYAILIFIAHYLLGRKKVNKQIAPAYSNVQKIYRAMFVGFMIAVIVFLGNTLGIFWGAAFTMFPAAFSSSMIVFHWNYKPIEIYPLVRKIGIGTISILIYSIIVMISFPLFGIIWGTLLAYLASLFSSILISKIS